MKTLANILKVVVLGFLILGADTGCESTGGSVSTSVYYRTGWYDPWYYGRPWHGGGVIVNPPPRPERPVHLPSAAPRPTPRPMPSIPTTPRPVPQPAFRR